MKYLVVRKVILRGEPAPFRTASGSERVTRGTTRSLPLAVLNVYVHHERVLLWD